MAQEDKTRRVGRLWATDTGQFCVDMNLGDVAESWAGYPAMGRAFSLDSVRRVGFVIQLGIVGAVLLTQ